MVYNLQVKHILFKKVKKRLLLKIAILLFKLKILHNYKKILKLKFILKKKMMIFYLLLQKLKLKTYSKRFL